MPKVDDIEWFDTRSRASIDEQRRKAWLEEILEKMPENDIWYIYSGDSMVLVTSSEGDGIGVYDLIVRRSGYIPRPEKDNTSEPPKPDEHQRMLDFFLGRKA